MSLKMKNNNEPISLCEMLRFDKEQGKRVKVKDCELLNSFFFSRNDFYLLRKNRVYYICIPIDGTPVLLWKHPEVKDGEKFLPNNVISIFRNGYIKNGITQNDIDEFISDPLKYQKKRLK